MIDHSHFKKRYIDQLNAGPLRKNPTLIESASRFCEYNGDVLRTFGVAESNLHFLASGMPVDAAPFLSFRASSAIDIGAMRRDMNLPDALFPIGIDGAGDLMVVDTSSLAVLLFRHDEIRPPKFVNSSVPQLAETLCLFQEHLGMTEAGTFLTALELLDPPACADNAMWRQEALNTAAMNAEA